MSTDSVFRPEVINYKTVATHNGRYHLRKLLPSNQATQSLTLAASATMPLEFKIPANTVFNPSRCTLDYQIVFPQEAAFSTWTFEDTIGEIASIQFGNMSGGLMLDLQYASEYVSVARKIDTDQITFEGGDATSSLYPSIGEASNFFPPTYNPTAENAYNAPGGVKIIPLTHPEPQYSRAGAAGAQQIVARSIPMSAFTHTILAMDRDMIFGEEMYIRLQMAHSSKVGYLATDHTSPVAGAKALVTQPALQQITFRLAVQVDDVVEKYVRDKFLAGQMSFAFPYPFGWTYATVGAVNVGIQYQLTNQYGKKLKRVIHTVFDGARALNKACDHQNMNGDKIWNYQTAIDSQPLQDDRLSCKQPVAGGARGMDDWRENKHLLRHSTIKNSAAYYLNWYHCDSFSNLKREASMLLPESNLLEGLDLTQPRTWSFTGDATKSLQHFTFAEFIREVTASPLGPTEIRVA